MTPLMTLVNRLALGMILGVMVFSSPGFTAEFRSGKEPSEFRIAFDKVDHARAQYFSELKALGPNATKIQSRELYQKIVVPAEKEYQEFAAESFKKNYAETENRITQHFLGLPDSEDWRKMIGLEGEASQQKKGLKSDSSAPVKITRSPASTRASKSRAASKGRGRGEDNKSQTVDINLIPKSVDY